jgi:hypothetical protein
MALLAGESAQEGAPADIVIRNARIFTGESPKWADAIAIARDRIAAVGPEASVKAHVGRSTRVIDAGGRMVIPGINDAHTHPTTMPPHTALEGPPAMQTDPSLDDILTRLQIAIEKAPDGQWIIGEIGGRVLDDEGATRATLDPLSGGHPVMLIAWHGHGTILNSAALKALGVKDNDPDPPGGRFGRIADGRTLNGRAEEYAEYIVRQRLTMIPGEEQQIAAYQRFAREAASFGITSVQAIMTGYPAARAARLFAAANLPIRVRVIDFPMESPAAWNGALQVPDRPMVAANGVKYIVDGTPIERLMFLREPYSDDENNRGRLNFDRTTIEKFMASALFAGVQPMFHVVGDAGIDMVLDAFGSTAGEDGSAWLTVRPRLEHADMFEPAHFARAARLGLIVVQNPSHLMIPDIMNARLGKRVERNQLLKSMLMAGVPLAFGSDGPLNPFLNIMFAVTHPANPSEALTVEEALVAYTRGSAFAEGMDQSTGQWMEQRKGTLAPGKLADLAILSQDIFEVPVADLPKTTSVLTMVGGRVVHDQLTK